MEITQKQLEKIKNTCFNLAKRFVKVKYNSDDRDFELYVDRDGVVFAKFMHWTVKEGIGINFAFKNSDNLLKSFDWKFCTWEQYNCTQFNSMIYELSRINDRYERVKIVS